MSTTTMRQKIKQKAIEIRNKRLGRDVREAMASGVELAGETAADALDMSEATKTDWHQKSSDGSFIPAHDWNGTKLRFKNPDGTNGAYQDLKGPAGSIENATAKDIKTTNGSNVQAYVEDTGWLDIALANGWKNEGGGYQTAQYRKIGKQVFLRGMINGSQSSKSNIARLPHAPKSQQSFIIMSYDGTSDRFGRIEIDAAGGITCIPYAQVTHLVSLAGINFFID